MADKKIDKILAMAEDAASVADLGDPPKPAAVSKCEDDPTELPQELSGLADDLAASLIGAMGDILGSGKSDVLDDVNKIVGDDKPPMGDNDAEGEAFDGDDGSTGGVEQDNDGMKDSPVSTSGDEVSDLKQRLADAQATIAELKAKLAGNNESDADRDNFMTDADNGDDAKRAEIHEGDLVDEDPDPNYPAANVDSTLGVDYSDIDDPDGSDINGPYDDAADDDMSFVQVMEDDLEDDDAVHIDIDSHKDDDGMSEDDGADAGDVGDVADVEEFDPAEFDVEDLGG